MQQTMIAANIGWIRKAAALTAFWAASLPGDGCCRDGCRAAAAQSVAVGNVRECGHRGAGGDGRAGLCLADDMDGLAGQDHRDQPRHRQREAQDWPCWKASHAGRCRAGQPRRPRRRRADHPVRGARGQPVGRHHRRRLQGTYRAAAGAGRGGDVAPDRARHRRARHHRRHRAVRRTVRHGMGHHECLHRHIRGAYHQPRRGSARHRRSAAGDRAGPGRGDPGGRDLQSSGAVDRGLPRAARRRLGAGDAADQPGKATAADFASPGPRSRSWAQGSAQADLAGARAARTTIWSRPTRSTSRRSST